MAEKDRVHDSDPAAGEMTSMFRADFVRTPDALVPASDQRPPPGSALLVVVRGPQAGSRLLLDKAVSSVGRHPDCDLFLDDVTVSRRHAELRVSPRNDVEVVDVGSLNGTYVNRAPIDSATLLDGDELQVGKFRLLFLTGGPRTTA